ncbi:dTDP-4-dehydrorhamnose 3,5-epimerase [Cecembia rubra]|uniref:dTDP-4-dehydrorhamnose 3,5-epimerase n=1 Tax=Cecembia rubra TaxID=1485585 RepID=A0A2P8EA44_9BACT|nr:dTDP-4-dehydrorhamnose 3,5-epimerase [Cecembia rubra]PSL06330.1 dTDP-4-dehydrorhamnose 3,5-epimerase [Cecembia rubra]
MKFSHAVIPDIVICEPSVFGDERGYFSEIFRKDKFEGFIEREIDFCQDNESKSELGVLRGLHYQLPPFAQSKLVRVIEGKVLDVAVDIRKGSPTFGKHVAIELSEENKKSLFIPRGFAHGFVVLSEYAIFSYKVDNYYSPEHDRGLFFDDPNLDIDWKLPANKLRLSQKDLQQPLLFDIVCFNFKDDLYEKNINYRR